MRNDLFELNIFRNLNDFFNYPLDLHYLRNLHYPLDHLLHDFLHLHYLLHDLFHWDKLLHHCRHLLNFVLNNYVILRDCLDHIFGNDSLYYSLHLFNLHHLSVNLNYFFYQLRNLDHLLIVVFNHNDLLDDPLYFDWHLDRNGNRFLDLYYFFNLENSSYDFLNFYRLRHFLFQGHYSFDIIRNLHYSLHNSLEWHNLLDNSIHHLLDLNIHILHHFDLDYLFLEHWYLDLLFDLNHFLDFNNPFNYCFYYLRNFHYLLDNPGHNHNLLHQLLHFNHFGDFHQLFNEFVDMDLYLFDLLHYFGDWDNLLDVVPDNLVVCDVVDHWFLYLHYIVLYDHPLHDLFHLDYLGNLDPFHHYSGYYLRDSDQLLLVEWNLNLPIHYLLDIFY